MPGTAATLLLSALALSGCKTLDSPMQAPLACFGQAAQSNPACAPADVENETTGSISTMPFEMAPQNPATLVEAGPRDPDLPQDPIGDLPPSSPAPASQRTEVLPKLAALPPETTAGLAARGLPEHIRRPPGAEPEMPGKAVPSKMKGMRTLGLGEAVAVAVLSHPLMGAQAAKIQSAGADIRYAEGALRPTIDVFAGTGSSTAGTYRNYPTPFDNSDINGTSRTDVGFTFKQLITDFGAARSEVARNHALRDAEKLRLADQAEDIAVRTVNAFLNLLEQEEMIRHIDETVRQQRALADLVKLSEQGGNGTRADLDRIRAKVIETEATRTDIKTAYQTALDEFQRLTGLKPQQVRRPSFRANLIPKSVEQAVADARRSNPSLMAMDATGVAFNHQIEGLKAQTMPKVEFIGDALNKHYAGGRNQSQGTLDSRAMVSVSFKLYDGGLLDAQKDRIRANQEANAFRSLDERETVELNLKRFYLTISSSRTKREAAIVGLSTAANVNKLYIEQFKAGKRTIFEVLDSNMLVFAMHRNRITGEFEEMRAQYGILRNLGKLCDFIAQVLVRPAPSKVGHAALQK